MSTFATTWAQQQRAGGTRAKAVLQVLADFADENGFSFPSIPLLARITEQSKRSVDRCLSQLEARGLIKIEPRFDERGRRTSSAYYLLAPAEALRGASKLNRPTKPAAPTASREKTVPEEPPDDAGGMRQVGASPRQADAGPRQPDGVDSAKGDAGIAPTVALAESSYPSSDPSEIKNTARARASGAPDAASGVETDPHWDAFWTAYPHPPGDPSKLAHEEWLAISESGGDLKAIAQAAKAYARGKRRSEWSVQAARWLREGRWSDWVSASASINAPTEPKIASNVSAADRAWLNDRWAALLKQLGPSKAPFVVQLVIVDIGDTMIRFTAPSAFLRDYAADQIGTAIERAFGRRIVVDLASPAPKGKVA